MNCTTCGNISIGKIELEARGVFLGFLNLVQSDAIADAESEIEQDAHRDYPMSLQAAKNTMDITHNMLKLWFPTSNVWFIIMKEEFLFKFSNQVISRGRVDTSVDPTSTMVFLVEGPGSWRPFRARSPDKLKIITQLTCEESDSEIFN